MDHALKNYEASDLDLIEENADFKELLKKCLTADYKLRPTSEDIFDDPFFEGYVE